jgi:hypothetical protein
MTVGQDDITVIAVLDAYRGVDPLDSHMAAVFA